MNPPATSINQQFAPTLAAALAVPETCRPGHHGVQPVVAARAAELGERSNAAALEPGRFLPRLRDAARQVSQSPRMPA